MIRELICPVCNKEFKTEKNAQKYCCSKCRRKANSDTYIKKNDTLYCAHCGKMFTSPRAKKYCSDTCRINANRRSFKRQPKNIETSRDLTHIVFLSRTQGMTYGQYVSKYLL